ncbi:PaaI family thioesterase [Streptomyces sp. B21-083]|uniref:PaaI family thioesterase n=1 Tax=Streptomyces sp. B21-083 TaxID=3039410 RepID=UPI002FEF49C7
MQDTTGVRLPFDPAVQGAFTQVLGLVIDAASPLEVRAHLDITADHHNPMGFTHGGVYASVIESVAGIGSALAESEGGGFALGVNNQTDFIRPHVTGRLDVLGRPVQQGRTLQLWAVEMKNADGRLVAQGQVRLYRRPAAG